MKAEIIRSFAAGLIVAGAVCGAVYFSSPADSTKAKVNNGEQSEETMKASLSEEGYMILTEQELNEKLLEVETEWKDKLTASEAEWQEKLALLEEADAAEKEKANETAIYRTIIHVSSGMTSIDVGRALVQAKVIDNAMDFVKEVEKRGLANKLKPGAYEVESNMNMDKAISIIFK